MTRQSLEPRIELAGLLRRGALRISRAQGSVHVQEVAAALLAVAVCTCSSATAQPTRMRARTTAAWTTAGGLSSAGGAAR